MLGIVVLLGAMVASVHSIVILRTRGYEGMGGRTIVRCRRGDLFTTIWIPGASLKAVRLGWARFQRCPLGAHWSLVTPVKDASLTPAERTEAAANLDSHTP